MHAISGGSTWQCRLHRKLGYKGKCMCQCSHLHGTARLSFQRIPPAGQNAFGRAALICLIYNVCVSFADCHRFVLVLAALCHLGGRSKGRYQGKSQWKCYSATHCTAMKLRKLNLLQIIQLQTKCFSDNDCRKNLVIHIKFSDEYSDF